MRPAVRVQGGERADSPALRRPRLGFAGLGWIGLDRMRALQAGAVGTVGGLCDPDRGALAAAAKAAPDAVVTGSFTELLDLGLDGIVVATPNALHAEQAVLALESGHAVFCQKPLARTAEEAEVVVQTAQERDLLLGVDFSYRFTAAARAIQAVVARGELGSVYAAELTFHNAYGPDKAWFRELRLSGGGCVMDLGVHLLDLVLWTLDFPAIVDLRCVRFQGGARLPAGAVAVEDFAAIEVDLEGGALAHLACSWNLAAGRDAVIECNFHGTSAGAALRNLGGSFYDLRADLHHGTSSQVLAEPPDPWGGRALVAWAEQVAGGSGFDPAGRHLVGLHRALDACYGR